MRLNPLVGFSSGGAAGLPAARRSDVFDREALGNPSSSSPGVQLSARDPAGNMVERNQRASNPPPDPLRAHVEALSDNRRTTSR